MLFFVIKNTSPFVQGRYYSYTKTYQDKLPIKIPETEKEKEIAKTIVKKVNQILELYAKKSTNIEELLNNVETTELFNFPSVSFSLKNDIKFEKIKVIKKKVFVNSEDYIAIENKQLRNFVMIYLNDIQEKINATDDVKNMIYTLRIPKSPKILKEIGAVSKLSKFENKIKDLEKEINCLVYELYGLSEKEIKIVENH